MNLADTRCPSCAHLRRLTRYGGTPTCAKAAHPMPGEQQFAVFAFERCGGRHFEGKR